MNARDGDKDVLKRPAYQDLQCDIPVRQDFAVIKRSRGHEVYQVRDIAAIILSFCGSLPVLLHLYNPCPKFYAFLLMILNISTPSLQLLTEKAKERQEITDYIGHETFVMLFHEALEFAPQKLLLSVCSRYVKHPASGLQWIILQGVFAAFQKELRLARVEAAHLNLQS